MDYEATTASYERVAVELLDNASRRVKGEVQVLFATHNEDTIRTLVQLLVDERPAATRIVYVRRICTPICTYMYVYVCHILHSAHSTPNPSTRQPWSVQSVLPSHILYRTSPLQLQHLITTHPHIRYTWQPLRFHYVPFI